MDGSFVAVNKAFAEALSYTSEEILRLSYSHITPQAYADQDEAQLEEIKQTGRSARYEKHLFHKDGSLILVCLTGQITTVNDQKYIFWSMESSVRRRTRIGTDFLAETVTQFEPSVSVYTSVELDPTHGPGADRSRGRLSERLTGTAGAPVQLQAPEFHTLPHGFSREKTCRSRCDARVLSFGGRRWKRIALRMFQGAVLPVKLPSEVLRGSQPSGRGPFPLKCGPAIPSGPKISLSRRLKIRALTRGPGGRVFDALILKHEKVPGETLREYFNAERPQER